VYISKDAIIFKLAAASDSQLMTRVSNIQRDIASLASYSRNYVATGKPKKLISVLISTFIMRPSSLGGGRILRRTLSVCRSVCPSVPLSLPSVTSFRQPLASRMYCPASVTSCHLAKYSDTDVLFATHWGPHIVRPSRPHKFLFSL